MIILINWNKFNFIKYLLHIYFNLNNNNLLYINHLDFNYHFIIFQFNMFHQIYCSFNILNQKNKIQFLYFFKEFNFIHLINSNYYFIIYRF